MLKARARLRRVRDLRLGGHPPDPRPAADYRLTPYKVRIGVNAGIDMFMEPYSYRALRGPAAGRGGRRPGDPGPHRRRRRRILTKKFELGLFERPFTDRTHLVERSARPAHRALARRAAARSQVLLKNKGRTPAAVRQRAVYVAGGNADDIGNQAGGWTVAVAGPVRRHHPRQHHPRRHPPGRPGRAGSPSARTPRPRRPATTSASWSWARPRTRRASATSAGPSAGRGVPGAAEEMSLPRRPARRGRRPGLRLDRHCVVLVVSGRPQWS